MSIKDQAIELIKDVSYNHVAGTTTTICSVILKTGFVVTGTSSCCLNAGGFDLQLGREYAYDDALTKLIEFYVFHLAMMKNN